MIFRVIDNLVEIAQNNLKLKQKSLLHWKYMGLSQKYNKSN